ncbi:MAG: hypothetical protein ACREWG_07210 [Gammaproteobacteria bacterium]
MSAERPAESSPAPSTPPLDLEAIAGVQHGERIRVQRAAAGTQELFEQTLNLLDERGEAARALVAGLDPNRFIPHHEDLRQRFLYAEALGSYEALSELIDVHTPGSRLFSRYGEEAKVEQFTEGELKTLEAYFQRLTEAITHAHGFLAEHGARQYTSDEVYELRKMIAQAQNRARKVSVVLGEHLLREVNDSLVKLHAFCEQIRAVERGVSGIFMVASEVMFVPVLDLVYWVNTIFKAVGNPYLTGQIDGLVLLAARSLIIEAVAFYSYYGKEQIYKLYKRSGGRLGNRTIAQQVRNEIRTLLSACQHQNKLILTRMTRDTEREFELSIEAIQREAVVTAVEAVRVLLPEKKPPVIPEKRRWWRRAFDRLMGRA